MKALLIVLEAQQGCVMIPNEERAHYSRFTL